jgi:hypothetical protein
MPSRNSLRNALLILAAGATAALGAPGAAAVPARAADAAEPLPVRQVALFRSGVGYFLRQGTVEDDATIELSFAADQINDILKSMVVFDRGGGQIESIGYASSEPLERRLAGFGVDLSNSPSVAELLAQLRGVDVALRLVDRTVEGAVLGVEKREVPVGDGQTMKETYVTLVTDSGMQSYPVSKIDNFAIADERLQRELSKALAALAESRDPDKKQVTIRLTGDGERSIMAAYVTEMPVWKMTYRLVLEDSEAARLQGWAIVENTTDSDWDDVNLSLVSGQPVSFVMNLYEPLFIDRPEVEVDVVSLARAPVYERAKRARGGVGGGANIFGGAGGEGRYQTEFAEAADMAAGQSLSFGAAMAGAVAAATGSVEGEQFFFELNQPVTLPRRQSAMVPVLNGDLAAHRLSIFNAAHLADHPMRGVRIDNTTGMALMPGPVTVFDGNLYAGDARLPRVAEADEQILSYAIDLDVDVKVENRSQRFSRTVKIAQGVLTEIERIRQTTAYDLDNNAPEPRDVIVEHPKQTNWSLVSPDAADGSTQNFHRFDAPLGARESGELEVVQERRISSRTALSSLGLPQLEALVIDGDVGPKVRQALKTLIGKQQEIAELERQVRDVSSTLENIEQDQERIRENIGAVDRDSELYSRYMNKLNEQETRLEDLQEARRQLNEELSQKRRDLAEHIRDLDIEG